MNLIRFLVRWRIILATAAGVLAYSMDLIRQAAGQ
jgi:hypothetical protein